jgi:hypothetical protein
VFEEFDGDEEEEVKVAPGFGNAGAFGGSTSRHACFVAFVSAICVYVCVLAVRGV